MRSIALLGASALALALASNGLVAQDVWSLEVRGGTAFPTQDFGVDELDTGVGFEGTVAYRFMPHLELYGGWDWYHFQADEALTLVDVDVEETGYAFGLRFEHPIEMLGAPAIWLRAGGTYNHIEIEDHDDTTADSGHGLGFELGAGIALQLSDGWYLTPGARFRALTREFVVEGSEVDVDLTYFALEVGVSRRF